MKKKGEDVTGDVQVYCFREVSLNTTEKYSLIEPKSGLILSARGFRGASCTPAHRVPIFRFNNNPQSPQQHHPFGSWARSAHFTALRSHHHRHRSHSSRLVVVVVVVVGGGGGAIAVVAVAAGGGCDDDLDAGSGCGRECAHRCRRCTPARRTEQRVRR